MTPPLTKPRRPHSWCLVIPGAPARAIGVAGLIAGLVVALLAADPAPAQAQGADTARDRPVELDTLVVTGSRTSADLPLRTRSVRVWTREELLGLPARTVADVLGWTLGAEVGARSPAQADLSLRGAGFEQVLVLVDGVRRNDAQTGHFHLNLAIPLEQVERIEVLRGPASAAYGSDAVGGVVNVVTRRDGDWSARLEGGSFGTVGGALRGGVGLPGQARLEVAAEGGSSDGHREGTDWSLRTGNAALHAPLAGGRLRGEFGASRRAFGAADFYAPFPSFETTRVRTAGLGWRSAPAGRVQVEPRLSWRSHGDDFILVRDDPALYRNRHRSTQLLGEVVGRAALGPGLTLAAGLEAMQSELESNALGSRQEGRMALFSEAGLGLPSGGALPWGVDVTAGLRYDDHERWGGFWSPSVAAAVTPRPGLRLRGSVGRAFRGPSWTERHYVDPAHEARDDLLPERSTAVEGGLDVALPGGAALTASAFRRSSRDLIDWARPAGEPEAVWETMNVSRARFRGFEGELRWRPGAGTELSAGAAHTSVEARDVRGLESKYALRPLADQLHFGAHRNMARGVAVGFRLVRARRAGEPSYMTGDLRLEAPVGGGAVYLDLRNVNDSDHLDLTGHPVAGRAVYLGFRAGPGALR